MDIFLEHDGVFEQLKKQLKNDIVQAEIRKLGDAQGRFQDPPLGELLNDTIYENIDWYPVVNFIKTPTKTDSSYK